MKPFDISKASSLPGNKGGRSAASAPPRISDHLANERTHLAYLRTAIALISFGITVNRFSIYLIESKRISERAEQHFNLLGISRVGFGMVIFGLALIVWAAYHFSSVSRDIDRGDYRPDRRAVWIITIGVLLIGGISLIWLFPH